MTIGTSITRRLIAAVLLLELMAAAGLVAAVVIHERQVEFKAFDANLRGTANALLGAVQEADNADDVMLKARDVSLSRDSIYSVTDEHGRVLGARGSVPVFHLPDGAFQTGDVDGRSFRFFSFSAERIIDPGLNGGIHHHVHVVYGQPDGHVWHEVLEAVRFVLIATALLLGMTTLLLVWLVRKLLSPIREFAAEAEKVSAISWQFDIPPSARKMEELRPLASAIEKMTERLHHSFEQQKRFTSDAAHELKTDLAIIKSSLQLLAMRKRTSIEYEGGLRLVLEDFTRMERTVQTMLTLARLEQPMELTGEGCRLSEALEDAVQHSSPFAAMRQVSLRKDHVDPGYVGLDRRDALLLCSNILVNALQHSPASGAVDIEVRDVGASVQLTVRDYGEGIAEEHRSHLFEPFYRGDASRSRKTGGTGLGLSICKAICDRCRGSIAISNHPAGGTLVTVQLPLFAHESLPELSGLLKP